MKTQFFRKTKILFITVLSTLLALCAVGFAKTFSVAMADQVNGANFLPSTKLENIALTNASAVYSDKNLTAIIDDSSKLSIHFTDETVNIDNLSQMLDVKLFDENTLLFTANARLYAYDLQQKTYAEVMLNDAFGNEVSVSYFDFNDNYLVTTYQDTCRIFTISNGTFTSYGSPIPIYNGSNVAINSNNQLFIVGTSGIYKTLANEPAFQTPNNTLTEDKPSQIISNNEFIYYFINDKIYRVSINDKAFTPLTTLESDQKYDLGKIVNKAGGSSSIKYITFCEDNLLVVQNDTIQEFAIDNNQLVFTGFAIAKGKTAYNRISDSATQIEKTNKNVGVLDQFKFTVYTENNANNKYARENYKNYLISDISNSLGISQTLPSVFALGENNALFLYNAKTSDSFVALLDFTKQIQENPVFRQPAISNETSFIRDICYQSGYYYLLCDDGGSAENIYTQHIYKASANAESLDFEPVASFNNPIETLFTNFNVDTCGNVNVANKTTVAQLTKATNYTVLAPVCVGFSNIVKMQSDLVGNLYVLDDGQIKRVINGAIDTSIETNNVKSFGFDFVDDKLYYLINDSETIYSTTEFENVSIGDLKVSTNFYLTNPQGDIRAQQNLNFYTINADNNAYVVESSKGFIAGNAFVYKALSEHQSTDEYVQICPIVCGERTFFALANQDTFVLVDESLVSPVDKQKDTSINQTAFITTNVKAYYLPIITPNATFALNDNSQKITVNKGTEIRTLFKISFLECDYYYAEFTDNGQVKAGYIPCAWTIDVLTEDFTLDEFKTEKVKKTVVYLDSDMQQEVCSLSQNTLVKIIEKGKTVCKIAYKDGNEYKIGYIYTSSIVDEPSLAVRNVIIILAVLTCVFSTSLYFILRKKRS